MNGAPVQRRAFIAGVGASVLCLGATRVQAGTSDRDLRFRRALGHDVMPPSPVGLYRAAQRSGDLIFLSTTVARDNGVAIYQGQVGRDLSLADAQFAAKTTALAVLETIYTELDHSLDRLVRIVNLTGYVVSTPGFTRQAEVMDGASKLTIEILGRDAGLSSRSAIGVAALTGNAAIAISGVAQFAI